uniref:Uncharacterized protein n=1 Tax=Oryza sativa subsp. japonica TaxID=39947 RepID=Q69NC8_ORYSJ|nr:hypothetical protein [Oryza sativa Japonica Group]
MDADNERGRLDEGRADDERNWERREDDDKDRQGGDEGRRGQGRPCRCDAEGGGGAADRRTGEEKGVAEGTPAWMAWRRRAAACSGFRAKQRSSRRRGRCSDVDGGDGDVGRCSGTGEGAAGGGAVAATSLFTREDASPVVSPRNGGDAGEEDAPSTLRVATPQPDSARSWREVRLEVGRRRSERRRRRGEAGWPRGDAGGG